MMPLRYAFNAMPFFRPPQYSADAFPRRNQIWLFRHCIHRSLTTMIHPGCDEGVMSGDRRERHPELSLVSLVHQMPRPGDRLHGRTCVVRC
jgi:hypothetical protein